MGLLKLELTILYVYSNREQQSICKNIFIQYNIMTSFPYNWLKTYLSTNP